MGDIKIEHADEAWGEQCAELFDQYRVFYGQESDLDSARQFMLARLSNSDSAILVAVETGSAVGFTQLYPSFSSVSMQRIWILNDLFVAKEFRRRGVAGALLDAAKAFAQETRSLRLVLATAIDNVPAKSLYDKHGWTKDEAFDHYQCNLD